MDSRRCYPGFTAHVKSLFNDPSLSDLTVLLDNDGSDPGQTKLFYAHRLVLCSVSDYFKAMLTGSFVEAHQREVRLNGVPYSTFERCMHCVYFGWHEGLELPWTEAAELFTLCSMLMLEESLRNQIAGWMGGQLKQWVQDIPQVLAFAVEHNLNQLRTDCIKYLAGDPNHAVPVHIFPRLPLPVIREIVDQPFLAFRVSELHEPIRRWVTEHKNEISHADQRYLLEKISTRYNGMERMLLSLAHVADQLVLPSPKQKLYCSQITFHHCLKLFGVAFLLRSNTRLRQDQSAAEIVVSIISSAWRNGQYHKQTVVRKKLNLSLNFARKDTMQVQTFFPQVQCCLDRLYRVEFVIPDIDEQPDIVQVRTTFQSKYLTVDNCHLARMYCRDMEALGERCEHCEFAIFGDESE